MMSRLCFALLLTSLAVGLSSCGLAKRGLTNIGGSKRDRDQEEEKKDAPRDTFVGVIESVNPEQQFVLVRIEQRVAIAAGTPLETRTTSGLRAKLVAGPERKLNFLAADIVEGLPHAGDVVVVPAGASRTGSPQAIPPGTDPATPGKLEPILTAEPPPGSLPSSQPGGTFSSPMSPPGGRSYTVPGAPANDPVPGVPPVGYPTPLPRVNPR